MAGLCPMPGAVHCEGTQAHQRRFYFLLHGNRPFPQKPGGDRRQTDGAFHQGPGERIYVCIRAGDTGSGESSAQSPTKILRLGLCV